MSHDPQLLYIGRRTLMARLAALMSSVPVVAMGARSARAQTGDAESRGEGSFEFGIMGDMPYTFKQEAEFAHVLTDLNSRNLEFVAHVGDMVADPRPYERNPKLARMPATDENYEYILKAFQTSKHPLILSLGDNDWADVVEFKTQKVDPLDRLAKVRGMFFPQGRSLGQRTIAVESQASDPAYKDFVENRMWTVKGVLFATFHIMGSNDNSTRSPELVAEYKARKAANMAWLNKAFARAKADKHLGLVLIAHANPGFENFWPPSYLGRYFRMFHGAKPPKPVPASAYDDYIHTLAAQVESCGRPTVLFHGDTHLFRIDKPLFSAKTKRPFENFTRVETFGWPDSHWVRVVVDPRNPELFTCAAQIVSGNRLHHM